jgi:pimeloyl-ACP methyl ester carboxylesterase
MLGSDILPPVQWHKITKEGYCIYWSGSHREGDFVQVYAPDLRSTTGEKPKVIVYLHGFALCLPRFYAQHLEELVAQGYFVIFPDFQRSTYPDPHESEEMDESRLTRWFSLLTSVILIALNPFKANESLESPGPCRSRKLRRPNLPRLLRVSLSLLVIFGFVNLIFSVFNRTLGKNLNQLLSTIGLSLLHAPKEWGNNGVDLAEAALNYLEQDYPVLKEIDPEVVVFGHSLGGLLALSWQSFLEPEQEKLKPLQIFTADPAPSTELGIPGPVVWVLKLFYVPFATEPLKIKETGPQLTLPVTIVHGASDRIVPPKKWIETPLFGQQSNYDYIASTTKRLYFSLSDKNSSLVAFHNQAVTNTGYFSDALFKHFGGIKNGANAYNFDIIWPWLQGVVNNNILPQNLAAQLPPKNVQVSLTLPESRNLWKMILAIIFGFAACAGIGYWIISSRLI